MRSVTFKAGGALTDGHTDVYIERQADRDVLSHILMMDYLLVIEPRQQGKTSLINHLMRHPGVGDCTFVYVDVTSPNRSTESTWYQTLCPRVLKQLSVFIPNTQWPDIPHDSAGWRDFLHEIAALATRSKRRVIIELDEIGAISFPGNTEFFTVLRDIYNSRQAESEFRHLTFLLAGAFHPRNLIKDDKISPFNIAQRVRLPDFTQEQVEELVRRGGWSNGQAKSLSERIHYWTDGQPYLTQLLCTYLGEGATPSDVDAGVERLRREDENHLPPMLEKINSDVNLVRYLEGIRAGESIKFYPQENPRQSQLELVGMLKADSYGFCVIRNRIYETALERAETAQRSHVSHATQIVGKVLKKNEGVALILKGGGVKGLALVGALLELEKYYEFNAYVGTSAGAIVAGLLAAECSPSDLEEILRRSDFKRFQDGRWYHRVKNFLLHFYLHPGREFEKWLWDQVKITYNERTGMMRPPAIKDLRRRLTIYASQEGEGTLVFDSHAANGNNGSYLTFAIRCSMSIPVFFKPPVHNGKPVFDGGLLNNFPARRWTSDNPDHKFIGVYLGPKVIDPGGSARVDKQVMNTVIDNDDAVFIDAHRDRVVVVDPSPIDTTDFDISPAEADFLVLQGRASALEHLYRHLPEHQRPNKDEVFIARDKANAAKTKAIDARKLRRRIKLVRRIVISVLAVITLIIVSLRFGFPFL